VTTEILHTDESIRAAGAEAVKDWKLSTAQVDKIAAILGPVQDIAYGDLANEVADRDAERAA
jgi:hypothetical protein